MIYIGSGVDKKYFNNHKKEIKKFFESLEKNSNFKNFIVCIGFKPNNSLRKKYPKIDFFYMKKNQLKSARKGWPINRRQYICLEGGEFMDFLDFNENDVVIFLDADMIMQRKMTKEELTMIENFEHDEVGMYYDCLPREDLFDYFNLLKRRRKVYKSLEETQKIFDGDWSKMSRVNAGCIVAKMSAWKEIEECFISNFENVTSVTGHHSAGQWLITWLTHRYLKVKILPPDFHNAHWFHGTLTKFENHKLRVDDTVVLFAHTKFGIDPTY